MNLQIHSVMFNFCSLCVYVWLVVRPVKVIRLVGRHSVEEIVLKRANRKLELTNTVIEGGQVSSESSDLLSIICSTSFEIIA